MVLQTQLTVQDAQLAAKWNAFFQDYMKEQIQQAALDYPETSSILLSFNDLQLHDPDLANFLVEKPGQCLRLGAQVLHQFDVTVDPHPQLGIRVRGLGESESLAIRNVRSEHVGKLRRFDAIIRKATGVKTALQDALFECKVCTTQVRILQDDDEGKLVEPVLCDTCEAKRPFRLVIEESHRLNVQRVQLEELTETMEVPSQPQRLQGYVTSNDIINNEHLFNAVGSRVRCTAIVHLLPPKRHQEKSVERDFALLVVDVEPLEESNTRIHLSPQDVEAVLAAAAKPSHIQDLVDSLEPGLQGLGTEKLALLLAVFGGVTKPMAGHYIRGDIHILLCGDPSTGKSKLLKAVQAITPRSVYTSGTSSSAAGLTCAVVKDEFDGQYTLEPGALPLSDLGICFADELDKVDPDVQKSVHQALEEQEISINKGGISATLKSRCSFIGACNPKKGRFDPYEPVLAQFNLSPSLMSRFAVILTLMDKVNRDKDRARAKHMAAMHRIGHQNLTHRASSQTIKELPRPYDLAFMRKFVTYAKAHVHPSLSAQAEDILTEFFLHMRGADNETIAISDRQFEDLIRMSEASARMRLSHTVDAQDAQRAVSIFTDFMKRVGLDQETGKFDIDLITVGTTRSQADRYKELLAFVRSHKNDTKFGTRETEILSHMQTTWGSSEEQTKKDLQRLCNDGTLYCPGRHDHYMPGRL